MRFWQFMPQERRRNGDFVRMRSFLELIEPGTEPVLLPAEMRVIVVDSFRHFRQQPVVPNVIEVALQIEVYDACLSLKDRLGHSLD
jgi:hypothetical protein